MCCGHPNIAFLYGVCNPNSHQPLIVTSFYTCSGKPQTFSNILPLTPSESAGLIHILGGILKGIQHMHRRGILHNDIKGDNVVLTDNLPHNTPADQHLWPIIIDFNKASPVHAAKKYNLTKKIRIVYKQRYTQLAPDLVDGLVQQCPATDIYSFGVLAKKAISDSPKHGKLVKPLDACTAYHSQNRPTITHLLSSLNI